MKKGAVTDHQTRNTYTKGWGLLIFTVLIGGWTLSSCDTELSSMTITAEEFRFFPNLVRIPARQRIRLIVRNQGRERHVFQSPILALQDVHVDPNGLSERWQSGEEISIQPGKRITISLKLPPGIYPFRCRIKGHKGMEGTLVVGE